MKTHKWKKTQNQAVPCFLTWGVCVSNPFLSFVELFFSLQVDRNPMKLFLKMIGLVLFFCWLWSGHVDLDLQRSECCPTKKNVLQQCGCNTPSPPWLPCLVEISLPQCYLLRFTSVPGSSWLILFEHLKHFFSLYCSRVFQLFWISFGGESCIFQVFPHGGEKDIIDEFCRRYSLFLFDVSNHSKVPSPRFYNFVHPIIFWLMGAVTKNVRIMGEHFARSHIVHHMLIGQHPALRGFSSSSGDFEFRKGILNTSSKFQIVSANWNNVWSDTGASMCFKHP